MEDNRIIECIERAHYILSNLMAVKPGEEVLIAIDPQTDMRMANAMAAAALMCGAEYNVSMMPIRGKDKATIFPKTLELAMEACDVFVGMTTASGAAIYNNRLKELMNEKKLREVSICLRHIDNFTRGGALADYEAVYADGVKLQAIWRGKKNAHITTPAGTDLYMEMNDMEPIIECGIARNPGDAMAWSDGEVSLGPVIGTTHGKLVIDGPICYYGCPTIPVELKIEGGRIVEVVGGDAKICKEIRRQIAEVKDSDNIAEIGIGLNPACMFNGDFEEEKKARGTCHIAMGNGLYYRMDGYRKEYVYSYYPTISIEIARGIPGVGKSSGDYGRIEADVHQSLMLGLCRRLNYHISAGLYTQQKSTYFADFRYFTRRNFPDTWDDQIGGVFNLLKGEWFNASDKYIQAHFMYESPFVLFKILRINSTKKFMQTASRYILSERFYWSQLWTPVLPSYTEVGYGIGNHIFNIGIFAGFDRWHYQSMGFKFAFELFQ